MQSSRRYGKEERELSLFQLDAGKEWRGGQRQSFFLARELQQKGYPIQFVVQPDGPLCLKARASSLSVLPQKIRSELDIAAVINLAKAMRSKDCRLVHFHDAHSAAVGSVAAFLAKVPLKVITRRVDFPLSKNYLSRLKYTRNMDAIIAISQAIKKVLIAGGIDSRIIRVIPSGVDFSVFEESFSKNKLRQELSLGTEDYLAGIVAQLVDHKGHTYLIEAARILRDKAPKLKILIVGEGQLRSKLEKQVRENQIQDMIYFLGYREDVPQILASLDLFILSSNLEGMGSSILDAMGSRLPVVATAVGGIPEVVTHEETGLLVSPQNPEALAEAILRLYNEKDWASRLGQKGYDVAHQKFSAKKMAERTLYLYEEMARNKGIILPRQASQ